MKLEFKKVVSRLKFYDFPDILFMLVNHQHSFYYDLFQKEKMGNSPMGK